MTVHIRIPEGFTLLGREWAVRRAENVEPDDEDTIGLCRNRDRVISVTSRMDGERALELFAHEFVHAGLFRQNLPDALEERLCVALEPVLLDFIKAVVTDEET